MTSVVSSRTAWIPSLTIPCNSLFTYSNPTGFCWFEQNNFNSEISNWLLGVLRRHFRHIVLAWPGFLFNMLDITLPTWWRKQCFLAFHTGRTEASEVLLQLIFYAAACHKGLYRERNEYRFLSARLSTDTSQPSSVPGHNQLSRFGREKIQFQGGKIFVCV